ncbi:ABC transporter substrate-binding protein [soil metagenome]
MRDQTQLFDRLVQLRNEGRIDRRQFMKLTSGTVGIAAVSAFIASCGAEPEPSGGGASATATPADSGGTDAAATATTGGDAGAGTTPAASEGEPVAGGRLISALDTNPVGLDPHTGASFAGQMVWENVYDTLFQFSPTLEVLPSVALSFEIIDDQTYQFNLRDDVVWQNGRQFTAEDVKYSIERAADASIGSLRASWFTPLEEIEVVDDTTCIFHLSEPFAPLVSYLAMPGSALVPREVVEEHGDLQNVAVGTGPFSLETFRNNEFALLKKFEDHWRTDLPYLDEHEIRISSDEQSRLAAIRAGEHEFSRMFDPQNAWTLEEEGYKIFSGLTASRPLTVINCRRAPLDDKRVRQALSYAINRQEMMDATIFGDGVLTGFIPVADEVWALPATEFESYTQDIDRARELLAEAGHENGFDLVMKVSPQYAFDLSNAQILQSQLAPLGINVEIEQVEWGNLLELYRTSYDFDLLNIILTHQPDPDGYLYGSFHSESTTNSPGISDPELDEMLDLGRRTADFDERKQIYDDLQRLLMDDLVPMLVTFNYNQYWPAQQYVNGYQVVPSISRIYLREVWKDEQE